MHRPWLALPDDEMKYHADAYKAADIGYRDQRVSWLYIAHFVATQIIHFDGLLNSSVKYGENPARRPRRSSASWRCSEDTNRHLRRSIEHSAAYHEYFITSTVSAYNAEIMARPL